MVSRPGETGSLCVILSGWRSGLRSSRLDWTVLVCCCCTVSSEQVLDLTPVLESFSSSYIEVEVFFFFLVLMNLFNECLEGYYVKTWGVGGINTSRSEICEERPFFCNVYVNKSPVRLCAVLQPYAMFSGLTAVPESQEVIRILLSWRADRQGTLSILCWTFEVIDLDNICQGGAFLFSSHWVQWNQNQ